MTANPSKADQIELIRPATRLRPSMPRLFVEGVGVVAVALDELVALRGPHVFADHFTNEFLEADLRLPTELAVRLRRVAEQRLHLGRPEVAWIDLHQAAPAGVAALFLEALAVPVHLESQLPCRDG